MQLIKLSFLFGLLTNICFAEVAVNISNYQDEIGIFKFQDRESIMTIKKVAVIGAGLAGLTTA